MAVARLSLWSAALMFALAVGLPAGATDAQDQDRDPAAAADAPLATTAPTVRLQLVLPESDVAPPAAQRALLTSVARRLIDSPAAALEAEMTGEGRMLTVVAYANPFATRGMPTLPETALQNLTARILLAWLDELDAIAAADARQRTAAHRAEVAQQMAEAKQRSLAAAARVESLTAQREGAPVDERVVIDELLAAAQRDRLEARAQLTDLQVQQDLEWPARPIRPEIVREIGEGQLIHDVIVRLRAAASNGSGSGE